MDTFEVLVRAGIDKKSAAVITALLGKGVLSLSQISAETHINRPALYVLLPLMLERGLVSRVQKQKRTFYQAESPARILESYNEDHRDVSHRLAEITEEYGKKTSSRPIIKYFEGQHGLTFVFDDIAHTLPRNGLWYRYSSRTGDTKGLQGTFYANVRDERGIERMVITSEEKARAMGPKLGRAVKAIPKEFDLFEDDVSLVIYGDKTAYIDYASKTSFIVESPKIARFQEKLFRLLYKKL